MRNPRSRALSLALIAALALPIAGCARNRTRTDLPYVARDVGTLYTAAKNRLDQGRYKEAALLFDEVERQHPYSIWARRAQLMSAFSYYLGRDYTQSIQSAQRFISVHPGNRDAPYAYYLIALGYYEQIQDVTRDQKITRQALDALGELMRRYPNSRYAADARLKVDLVNDHLAGKEMEIGRFYEDRHQWLAASMRFRTVVDKYQTTSHTPEALLRLTETYLALGVRPEAERAAAVLGANYPGSDWYNRAYKLMREYPVETIPPIQPGQPVVPQGTPGSVNVTLPGSAGNATPSAAAPGRPTPTGNNSSPTG
ncbi:outer membrane protein assembly factor BamD [Sphingomonas sp. SORGH_AS 950]|uniref:outer membrane protein assembly factor BamD n=1 Tax=unclassified Sphingomonas TaxID=196159 RepID=UPI00278B4E48|nr:MULTISPECIES: outer membrane protein assembly factor BamD [unclassified Sphingomonas]MDQ1157122.1 outer membrane protein assembly factor BamD [Sphingomonas sp. SORGH_AS_0950]MDR6114987.1 outer membrane protein assembly factor BamD [Sphingomonas sp. SORGH_AS_0789]MDR6147516.1 outer membrane protein assembly factor BamD [Sphingomonas sp. SORGH_AS_0870]MDR6151339.1 outer membrane protein assembly factor BamD [Sphingomonas sp. SORGH_AS_0742]